MGLAERTQIACDGAGAPLQTAVEETMPSTRVDLKYGHWEAPEALLTSLCPVLGFTDHTEIQESDVN